MNEVFSKSLNDAVTKTADEIAEMSTNYIDTALEAQTKVIDGIINKYETTFEHLPAMWTIVLKNWVSMASCYRNDLIKARKPIIRPSMNCSS